VDGDGSAGLAVFSAGIAAVAAGIAVWRSVLAGRQAREARKARELNAVIALFEAHQSEDTGHLRRLLRNHTIGDHLDDPELRIHLRAYVNQLNFIATLRARGLLGEELVRDLFYEAAKTCWEQTANPFIRDIRATQNEDFARELQAWINAPDP
jgi:hypothetical protein